MIIYATLAPYTGAVVSRFGAKRPMYRRRAKIDPR